MNQIYRSAKITLVSAAGNNANAGFPGFGTVDRNINTATTSISGFAIGTAAPTYLEAVDSSRWESRGWTLQEKIFSRRILVFTKDQVFFRCTQETLHEDTVLESPSKDWVIDSGVGPTTAHMLESHDSGRPNHDFDRYADLVQNYTQRQLSKDEDALLAFSGISSEFQASFDGSETAFYFGIPEAAFEEALCWQHLRPSPRRPGFPSWSWAGWVGQAYYGNRIIPYRGAERVDGPADTCDVTFHLSDPPKRIQSRPVVPTFAACSAPCEPPGLKTTAKLGLPPLTSQPAPLPILQLHTSHAHLRVRPDREQITGDATEVHHVYLPADPATVLGEMYVHPSWRRHHLDQDLDFIVIWRDGRQVPREERRDQGLSQVWIMCLEWVEHVAYRVALVQSAVDEALWIRAEPNWRCIILG